MNHFITTELCAGLFIILIKPAVAFHLMSKRSLRVENNDRIINYTYDIASSMDTFKATILPSYDLMSKMERKGVNLNTRRLQEVILNKSMRRWKVTVKGIQTSPVISDSGIVIIVSIVNV